MNKKTLALAIVAAVLGGLYVYYGTDLVSRPRIQIIKSNRPVRSRNRAAQVYPIAFTLDGKYQLTSVRVVSLDGAKTNHGVPSYGT